jgi:hypothetical protein
VFFDGGSSSVDGVDQRRVLEHREREGSEMCGRNEDGKGQKVELTREGGVGSGENQKSGEVNAILVKSSARHIHEVAMGDDGLVMVRFCVKQGDWSGVWRPFCGNGRRCSA